MEERHLSPDAVERVLRRASELAGPSVDPMSGTSERAVLEAATEVGLPAVAVRTALALERLPQPPKPQRLDFLRGPRVVAAERVIGLAPADLIDRIDAILTKENGMRRARAGDLRIDWTKRADTVGVLQRTALRMQGGAQLGTVSAIALHATPVGDDLSPDAGTAVRIFADRSQQAVGQLAAGAAVGAFGAAGLVAAAVVATPLLLAASPVVAVAAVATSRVGRRQARTIAVELERVLDMVERGLHPVGVLDGVRRIARRVR